MKILGIFDTRRDAGLDHAISQVREDQPDAESLSASGRKLKVTRCQADRRELGRWPNQGRSPALSEKDLKSS